MAIKNVTYPGDLVVRLVSPDVVFTWMTPDHVTHTATVHTGVPRWGDSVRPLFVAFSRAHGEIHARDTNGSGDCHDDAFKEATYNDLLDFVDVLSNRWKCSDLCQRGVADWCMVDYDTGERPAEDIPSF